jgi:hypothetical protein
MRRALILLVLLFAIAVGVFAPSEARVKDRNNPCKHRCHEGLKEAKRRCHQLPAGERGECERRLHERFEACVRNCR